MLSILCLSFSFLIYNVIGHSFMECSDYRGVISGQDYDFDLCYGFPRYWIEAEQYWPDFGDTGGKTNRLASLSGVDLCKDPIQSLDEDYDDVRPYATYTVGSTIRLVWPAKNHANYECKSYTADNTMQIWVLPEVNPTTDSTDLGEWELVIDWHAEAEADGYVFENGVGIDGIPFQNCPDFCDETDNAPCFGDWEFTEDLYSRMGGEEGYYTFLWLWEFGEGAYYTTCWEAMVEANGVVVTLDTDTDGNDGGSDSESAEPEDKEYQFTIPVCYEIDDADDNALDNTLLMNAFDNLAAKDIFNGEVEFSLSTSIQNNADTRWNASITSNYVSYDFYVLLYRFIDNGTLCNLIMDEFGNTGSCSICGGASAHAEALSTNVSSGSDEDEVDGTLLLIGIIFVLVFFMGLLGYYFCVYQKQNQNNGKANGAIMATHITSANANTNAGGTQGNIVASGDSPVAPSTTNGARPPRPPPPRPTNA